MSQKLFTYRLFLVREIMQIHPLINCQFATNIISRPDVPFRFMQIGQQHSGPSFTRLETPLQEKSNCSHVLFGHHPALFIPFWTLNIHILSGVNFKIPPPFSPSRKCQTFFHPAVRPLSLFPPSLLSFFFFDISLSISLSSPTWLKYRETRPRYVAEPRNIVLFSNEIFDVIPFHDHDGLWISFFF